MGKIKNKKIRKRHTNPVGIPSLREVVEEIESNGINSETSDVDSILEMLQSPNAEDKECAARNITNMSGDPSFVASVIEKKIIRIAGPLLIDKNVSVRHSVVSCLRSLASYGDYSVCQAMVEQDILTSLVALLMEYREPWAPKKSSDEIIDSRSEIFLEACNLLWSLCESSDTAVSIFNQKELIRLLLPCLNIDVYGLQIPLAVAQCLNAVGEENAEVNEQLSQPLIMEQLKTFMALTPIEPEHILLKTLATSIVINILSGKIEYCMNDITNPIGEVIHCALSQPVQPALVCLSQDITVYKQNRSDVHREYKDIIKKLETISKSVKSIECILESKQIALEILANIITNNGSEEWEDCNDSSSGDEMEMQMDCDENDVSHGKLGLEISAVIHDIITHYKLFDKVIQHIILPEEDITKVIAENSTSKDILKRLTTVKCRALLCLNNMIQALSVDDLGGLKKLFELWVNIVTLLLKKTDISNTEELDATTSSMRAILQKLGEANHYAPLSKLEEWDLQLLMNIYHQTEESTIKVNIIQSLGTIGSLIANSPLLNSSSKHINIIGEFLLEVCSKCSELWVIAESLDSIFDVFAEDHVDYIAQEIRLVEKLKHIKKYLEPKWKQQHGCVSEQISVIKSARTNLKRFIDYKRKFCNK